MAIFMKYKVAGHTDIGVSRKNNQDAYGIQVADTPYGQLVFAVLCDGVGGMNCGELSSATVTKAFFDWFEQDFLESFSGVSDFQAIANSWASLLDDLNRSIKDFSLENQIRTGTTVALLLLYEGQALMANIGDSRIYFFPYERDMIRISKDHTLAQREYDAGKITKEDLLKDKRSHILLQCVGASAKLKMDAAMIEYKSKDAFSLCTDGFYRKLTDSEIAAIVSSRWTGSQDSLKKGLEMITDTIKGRKETDNITVVVVQAE